MPKKEYEWDDGNVPVIGEHSLAKHRILREYVGRYIEILTANPRIEGLRLTLVDGFAGGGIYKNPIDSSDHLGSPAILIQATAAAETRINQQRVKPVSIKPRYIFIEKRKANVAALEATLKQHVYSAHPEVSPLILPGTFDTNLPNVVREIKKTGRSHRAIFLLDQYGYTAVPIGSLQHIFAELPNAEVFLTVAVGWIAAYLKANHDVRDTIRKSLGIRQTTTEEEIEEHLLAGQGSEQKLAVVQKALHDEFSQNSGAAYATPFFIVSSASRRQYWFLHLANSVRAHDVVKELHWEIENHFSHYGKAGLAMLGFDPARDPAAQTSFKFDSFAKQQTVGSLAEELPRRIADRYGDGVTLEHLFSAVANETPATMTMVQQSLTQLCRDGELAKRGAKGERRRRDTVVRSNDIVTIARQTRMFT